MTEKQNEPYSSCEQLIITKKCVNVQNLYYMACICKFSAMNFLSQFSNKKFNELSSFKWYWKHVLSYFLYNLFDLKYIANKNPLNVPRREIKQIEKPSRSNK